MEKICFHVQDVKAITTKRYSSARDMKPKNIAKEKSSNVPSPQKESPPMEPKTSKHKECSPNESKAPVRVDSKPTESNATSHKVGTPSQPVLTKSSNIHEQKGKFSKRINKLRSQNGNASIVNSGNSYMST
ncbi:hypothetical protein [Salirhabdus salicampi]|uniref:hypothetical protein n=1 Tax=Salirhabdus salicampi TaxID=476102 RepID=UPI0020C4446C|nr:hypothetical protein [Salirhabdus salicampi]MCP8615998.1 hypothetical protein [Salirhabdus salicampi]